MAGDLTLAEYLEQHPNTELPCNCPEYFEIVAFGHGVYCPKNNKWWAGIGANPIADAVTLAAILKRDKAQKVTQASGARYRLIREDPFT